MKDYTPYIIVAILILGISALFIPRDLDDMTDDGRVKIRYWEKWTGFEKDAMEAIVDKYNASQDKVYVEFISTSQIDRKLLLATAGGNPPDIAGFWSHAMVSYAEKGVLYPLDSLMERDGLSRDDYVPSIINTCVYRDFVWGLPATPATVALHYNKDSFREAGLDPEKPPTTIEEFDRYARLMTKVGEDGNYTHMGFVPNDPGWWDQFWGVWFGAKLLSDDGKELLCNSPENVRAFEWYRSYVTNYDSEKVRFFSSAHRGQFASSSNSFMSGRVAMKQQGVWMANFIEKFGDGMDWAAAPFPSASYVTGGPATIVETDMLVIPRGSRHVEEAWDFIKFVQKQENIEELCLLQKKFSPRKEVSEGFYEKHPNPYIRMFRALAESPNAQAVPKTPVWIEYRDELGVAQERLWVTPPDKLSVKDALDRVKERMQPKLDLMNERWEAIGQQRLEEWSNL
ncbi:ABC transporter substrate-binding protein [bacterium]|nr:ABC transporter substrate-binding protein [bacterium]